MSNACDAIRTHHRELVGALIAHVGEVTSGDEEASALIEFLESDLLPHAASEERGLYPAIEELLRTHGSPTATMVIDHEFIRDYVRQIEETAGAMARAGHDRSHLESRLRRLGVELEAVLRLHVEKEERVYLPLFEAHLSAEQQEAVLDAMHAAPLVDTESGDDHKRNGGPRCRST